MKVYAGIALCAVAPSIGAAQGNWRTSDPGKAKAVVAYDSIYLRNNAIEARFMEATGGVRTFGVRSLWDPESFATFNESFHVRFRDGHQIGGTTMRLAGHIAVLREPHGQSLAATLRDAKTGLVANWRATLEDGAHYVREILTLRATVHDADIASIYLLEGSAKAKVSGSTLGSPIVTKNQFFGIEHPMSISEVDRFGWKCHIDRKIPLRVGQSVTYSAVAGVAPTGQMRRSFLAYLERERPRKYEPFLHYNSWYDLGHFSKYNADECVDRITTYGRELAQKRGVKVRSFLFDDGWDDTSTVWKFHSGFPTGFLPLKMAAEKFGADPGIWLSPWGGYSQPRMERLATGKKAGMEIDSQGYALSGPQYYARFHEVCLDLVKKYGINQFKFDGTGSPDKQYPGSAFASDFEAAIALIHDLRTARPGLFINLTTGTWPSPFWTQYADSIWRGGEDHSFAGVGPWREKWITYRDGDTYHGVVQKGPLYPLNSLMLHGLIYAKDAQNLKDDPTSDFQNEVRSYFGTGTQLEEMYITPSKLSTQNWNDLAESAKWAYANRDTLVDTHWVGGDPLNLEVYGWASWSPRKAILVLRNPSDKAQAYSIDPRRVFELPAGVKGVWRANSAYHDGKPALEIPVNGSAIVELKPFEVRELEGSIH